MKKSASKRGSRAAAAGKAGGGARSKTGGKAGSKAKAGSARSRKPSGAGEERAALLAELRKLTEDVDAEGLAFLIDQTRILLYNAQVEKMNRELDRQRSRLQADLTAGGKRGDTGSTARDGRAAGASGGVSVEEGGDRSHFIVTLGGARKFFVLDELRSLVKICQAAGSKSAGAERLYRWLSRNRTDVLADAGIGGPASPLLKELHGVLTARYRARE